MANLKGTKYKTQMTGKQRATLNNVIENPTASLKTNMIKGGYSPATAKHPTDFTESKPIKALLSLIDDEKLLKRVDDIAHNGQEANSLKAAAMLLLDLKGYRKPTNIRFGRVEDSVSDIFVTDAKPTEAQIIDIDEKKKAEAKAKLMAERSREVAEDREQELAIEKSGVTEAELNNPKPVKDFRPTGIYTK